MRRIFNVAGPCNPQDHYMIDAVRRLGAEVFSLVQDKQYFVIHAARQTGKTTLLRELTRRINADGKYYALYCSLEN
ncbi:MAG: AAA family ATPase, partial [Clostridiales bacterium]|nr:AAA family ATPase [Clostridiales bacterium]